MGLKIREDENLEIKNVHVERQQQDTIYIPLPIWEINT